MGKFCYYFFQNKFPESSRDLQNDAFRYIDTAKNMNNIDSFQFYKDDFKDTFTM